MSKCEQNRWFLGKDLVSEKQILRAESPFWTDMYLVGSFHCFFSSCKRCLFIWLLHWTIFSLVLMGCSCLSDFIALCFAKKWNCKLTAPIELFPFVFMNFFLYLHFILIIVIAPILFPYVNSVFLFLFYFFSCNMIVPNV